MRVADFDFSLPAHLIAQHPLESRDASRLMVLHKGEKTVDHKRFSDILSYVSEGDVLVVNDTKVLPARVYGTLEPSGRQVEILLLQELRENTWEALVRPGKRVKVGMELTFSPLLQARVLGDTPCGGRVLEFAYQGDFYELLDALGVMPLPPYITAPLEEQDRYQTVYSKHKGSVAAPTAGLHFTPSLLHSILEKGVKVVPLTLHVGLGTFRPVYVEDVLDHTMHREFYSLTKESAREISSAKKRGKRIIAVGTTVVRTLEAIAKKEGSIQESSGWTDIFIYPGFTFSVVDALITNFHLPKSTLLMLVQAFGGCEFISFAYKEAIKEEYRFYSFGDAMLIHGG